MKALNNIMFVAEASRTFESWLRGIDQADNFDTAKSKTAAALGFIDCMIVYLNVMIDKENNEFTGELGDVIDSFRHDAYQHLINKADELGEPSEVIFKLCKKRDGEA